MDVEKVARLARVALTSEEIERFSKDLANVLEMFKVLDKVDVDDVRITLHPTEVKNIIRKDETGDSLSRKKVFLNEKNEEEGYFKGPKAIE